MKQPEARAVKFRVAAFTVSIDGYGAGPRQSLEHPMGIGGVEMHDWHRFNPSGVDEQFSDRSFENVGAWILGRNMFGPVRGPWPDDSWKGWWGDEPPYHCDVFVLTHHPRESLAMGGTTFHFVTDGIEAAARRARVAANGKDVRVGGGVSTIQQFLRAGMIDEIHLAQVPFVLGSGEQLFAGIDVRALGFRCVERVAGEKATHVVLAKQ
jgi:dihydrofolate reductase